MNDNIINWNEIWKNQASKNIESNNAMDCACIWQKKENARQYWEAVQNNKEQTQKTIKGLALTPDSRILDIGAGPGTLTIPVSHKVTHVTAVEPSEGMMSVLLDNIAEYGIDNVKCVRKRWEDVDVTADLDGPYDVVIASYSLGMPDIKEAMQKMMDASSRYVYVYWFAGEPSWDTHYRALWPSLYEADYQPGLKCDVIYNVLYQMGIYPHMEVSPVEHINRFYSIEEAIEHFRVHYSITTDHQESVLKDYLQGVLEKNNDSLVMRNLYTSVKIWWEKHVVGNRGELI